MVAKILNWVGSFFQNLLNVTLHFLGDMFGSLINGLVTVLKFLFTPILALLGIIFYFIYKLGVLIVTLIKVLVAIGKLLYAFVMGLFKTLAGLVWIQSAPPDHGSWSNAITQVFIALEPYQLDKIAYVLSFAIWIMTAYGVIRILSSSGGDD
ncbi:hypothetical protein [uncultured Chitinophaga sp.]|jgi:hypothetical protein|uniref:hypothetical protein n=1 Tax=uncultured Chitinophaga sp. TaxID=339340 RepID=UPI00261F7E89|nr:hypothetical protein [uncultured Chitinophaga sp.]